jgi:hypothetical protein
VGYFLKPVANDWRPVPIDGATARLCVRSNWTWPPSGIAGASSILPWDFVIRFENAAFLCGDFLNANERQSWSAESEIAKLFFLHVTRLS